MSPESPLPPWTVLSADPRLRTHCGYRYLMGGGPLRIISLTEHGGRTVRDWFAGVPIGADRRYQNLALRLIEAGMAHIDYDVSNAARFGPDSSAVDGGSPDLEPAISVVIPVRDDHDGVRETLRCLRAANRRRPVAEVVVVDDGSSRPIDVSFPLEIDRPEVVVLRNDRPRGPAAARNQGTAITSFPTVVFIDAGVTFDPARFDRLLRWWPDPVVAVAPRVRSRRGAGVIAHYERRHSPLDMGPISSLVGPGRPVTYVPSTFLVVRRRALAGVGGFDEDLRFGEDVDLVWRLSELGWVQYRGDVVVAHPPRPTLGRLVHQRFQYGSSAAPLARRHGGALAPFRLQWSAIGAVLTLAGRPLAATAAVASTALRLRPTLSPLPDPGVTAAVMAGRAWWHQLNGLVSALARPWWPILGLGLLWPPTRRRSATVVAAAVARHLVGRDDASPSPIVDVTLATLDDLAYGAGVWVGAARTGTIAPLLPDHPPIVDRGIATER